MDGGTVTHSTMHFVPQPHAYKWLRYFMCISPPWRINNSFEKDRDGDLSALVCGDLRWTSTEKPGSLTSPQRDTGWNAYRKVPNATEVPLGVTPQPDFDRSLQVQREETSL